jgi:hypothetical protein
MEKNTISKLDPLSTNIITMILKCLCLPSLLNTGGMKNSRLLECTIPLILSTGYLKPVSEMDNQQRDDVYCILESGEVLPNRKLIEAGLLEYEGPAAYHRIDCLGGNRIVYMDKFTLKVFEYIEHESSLLKLYKEVKLPTPPYKYLRLKNGMIVLAGLSGELTVLDNNFDISKSIEGVGMEVWSMVEASDRLIIVYSDKFVRIWCTKTFNLIKASNEYEEIFNETVLVYDMVGLSDGRIYYIIGHFGYGGYKATHGIWDIDNSNNNKVLSYKGFHSEGFSICETEVSVLVSIGHSSSILVYSKPDYVLKSTWEYDGEVRDIVSLGHLIAVTDENTIKLWTPDGFNCLQIIFLKLLKNPYARSRLKFTGRYLSIRSDDMVHVWELITTK